MPSYLLSSGELLLCARTHVLLVAGSEALAAGLPSLAGHPAAGCRLTGISGGSSPLAPVATRGVPSVTMFVRDLQSDCSCPRAFRPPCRQYVTRKPRRLWQRCACCLLAGWLLGFLKRPKQQQRCNSPLLLVLFLCALSSALLGPCLIGAMSCGT